MLQTLPSQIRSSRCLLTLCLSARDMASHTHCTAQDGTGQQDTAEDLSPLSYKH